MGFSKIHPLFLLIASTTLFELQILELIFQLRANSYYQIGLPGVESATITYGVPAVCGLDTSILTPYTPYIVVDHRHGKTLTGAVAGSGEAAARVSNRKGRGGGRAGEDENLEKVADNNM